MLDSKHKKYIDDLCDILVAKFPVPQDQVDQITIALTYKFMNDMDKESVSLGGKESFFIGDWAKYSWDNLFDSKTTGNERQEIYKYVVENLGANPNLPPLFREIFSNPPNPFNDVKKLFEFLKIIDCFTYENSETLGNSYEYLLSKTGAQGKLGQFRTPRHIIDFIVEIINPKSTERILDPACGTAGFLVSAFKHIKSNKQDISAEELLNLGKNLVGYDIEPKMVRISLLNLFLQGFQTPQIIEQDLLSDDSNWNNYFDVILANPPFFTPKGGISPHRGFTLESKRAEIHFLDYIQSHITPVGRGAVIVPEGILFKKDNAYQKIRKTIIENSLLGVISLPAGVFKPYSGVKTSILLLDKRIAKQNDSIFFAVVKNDGYALNDNRNPIKENDIPKIRNAILQGQKEDDEFFYVSKEEILNNEKLLLSANIYKESEKINSEYPTVKLLDVFKVVTPVSKIKSKDFLNKGKYPIIDQSKNEVAGYWNKEEDKMSFQNPTIIFGDHTRSVKFVDFEFVVGADGVKILEPNEKILPKFFFYILKTLQIPDLGYSRHFKELKNKEIPLPPLEVQQEIVDELEGYQKIIDGCKQVIENYKPTTDIDPSWEMVELGEVCEINKESEDPKNIFKDEFIYVDISSVESKTGKVDLSNKLNIKDYPSRARRIFKKGDILLSSVRPNLQSFAFIDFDAENYVASTGFMVLSSNKEKIQPQYLYSILFSDTLMKQMISKMQRGSYPSINQDDTKGLKLPLPSLDIQNEIVQKIEKERKVIDGNKKLIEIYTQKIQDRINKVWGN